MSLKPYIGKCDQCGEPRVWITSNKPLSGSCCVDCKKKKKPKVKIPLIKKRRKKTGEGLMFQFIWETRPHYCEVCGKHLGLNARAHNFAHILPKGKYPEYRLLDSCIALLCFSDHEKWDTKRWLCRNNPKWGTMYRREFELKQRYNDERRQRN